MPYNGRLSRTLLLLEPFMCGQCFLEGESYVTVLMIAFMVWKIQKGLVAAIISETSSQHVKALARIIYMRFEEQWGSGNKIQVCPRIL
jgi:hypothetical protein